MTFLRGQEFYESVNPEFQGKEFSIFEYMSWYSKTQSEKKTFSYSDDWRGFNVPSHVLKSCYEKNKERTPHDELLVEIMKQCNELSNGEPYYLLGVRLGDMNTLDHEIAHGFYTTEESYKKGVDAIVAEMNVETKNKILKRLHEIGYAPSVGIDELQAFMSTGLSKKLESLAKPEEQEEFVNFFKSYNGGWKLTTPVLKIHETA